MVQFNFYWVSVNFTDQLSIFWRFDQTNALLRPQYLKSNTEVITERSSVEKSVKKLLNSVKKSKCVGFAEVFLLHCIHKIVPCHYRSRSILLLLPCVCVCVCEFVRVSSVVCYTVTKPLIFACSRGFFFQFSPFVMLNRLLCRIICFLLRFKFYVSSLFN